MKSDDGATGGSSLQTLAAMEEYRALKAEQLKRIGFRDNLIYVTVTVVGGIAAFGLSDDGHLSALLITPWVTMVLGWTYLVNDQKISAIGRYVRLDIEERMTALAGVERVFGWEFAHRSDKRRVERKWTQLFVDELTFVGSGILALTLYLGLKPERSAVDWAVAAVEGFVLLVLGAQILSYLDWRRSRYTSPVSAGGGGDATKQAS